MKRVKKTFEKNPKGLRISSTAVNSAYTLALKTWFSLVPAKHKIKNKE